MPLEFYIFLFERGTQAPLQERIHAPGNLSMATSVVIPFSELSVYWFQKDLHQRGYSTVKFSIKDKQLHICIVWLEATLSLQAPVFSHV